MERKMKKLMLILLITGNCYAEDSDPYYIWGDFGKQASVHAQIRKDNAVADYLNRQPTVNNFIINDDPPTVRDSYPSYNNQPTESRPLYPNQVYNYGNKKR